MHILMMMYVDMLLVVHMILKFLHYCRKLANCPDVVMVERIAS